MRTVQLFQKLLKTWLILVVLGGLYANIAHAAVVDIVVNQSDSPDPIAAGGLLTYTIVLTNNGPDDATGVVLTDTIPATTAFSSVSTTKGSCTGTTSITCTVGSLLNGESATILIKVIPSTVGTITNTATSTRNEPDSNATNNADTDVTTVQTGTDLSITKTDSADPVAQADAFSYTITARNNGPYALGATDVLTMTDNIPSGLRVSSLPTGTGWTCVSSLGASFPQDGPFTLTCTKTAALAVSANSTTITVPVVALSLGTITNQAAITSTLRDDNTTNDTVTQSTTVNQAANVAITKSVSQAGSIGLNQTYTWTLIPTLVSGTTGTITVTDNIPAGAALMATPTGTGWTCTPNSGFPLAGPQTVSCTRASASNSLPAALSLNNISVSFKPTATGSLSNSTSIDAGTTDPVLGNNTSNTVTSTVVSDVAITKSVSQVGNIGVNQNYTWTLAPTLIMGTTGTITVTDNIPAGAALTATPTGAGWTCTPNSGFPVAGPVTVSCTHASAGNPSAPTISLGNISVPFRPTAVGTLNNTASIDAGVTDTSPANNTSSAVSSTVVSDVAITKSVSQAGNLGLNQTYSWTLAPTLIMGTTGTITVTDNIPAGVDLMATPTGTGWTCTPNSGFPLAGPQTVSCTRASAGNPSAPTISLNNISISFRPTTTGSISNTASINPGVTDTTPANNTSTAVTSTIVNDVSITKAVSQAGNIGNSQTYTYTLQPSLVMGTTGATITVTDSFPAGANLLSTPTGTGWTCTPNSGFPLVGPQAISCTRAGPIGNAGTSPISLNNISYTFSPTANGTLTNTTTINSGTTESTPANNTANVTNTVINDVAITKVVSQAGNLGKNRPYSYTLQSVLNMGTTGGIVTVTDSFPAGANLTALPTGAGWTCASSLGAVFPQAGPLTITCTHASATNTGPGALSLGNITVNFTTTATGALSNTTTVSMVATDTVPLNNTDTVNNTVINDLRVVKTASTASPVVGTNYNYTLTPSLVMGDAGGTITMTDSFPAGANLRLLPTGAGWTCVSSAGAVFPQAGPLTITCTRATATNNGSGSLALNTVTVPFTPTAAGAFTNTATIYSTGITAVTDTAPLDNTSSITLTVTAAGPDLTIAKNAYTTNNGTTTVPNPLSVGTTFYYRLRVSNSGASAGSAGATTTVTDIVPTGVTITAVTLSTGWASCTSSTGSFPVDGDGTNFVQCTRTGAIAIGASFSDIRFSAIGTAAGPITNTATVATTDTEPNVSNNSGSVIVTFRANFDLTLTKLDNGAGGVYGPDPVAVGDTVDYRLRVTNGGPDNVPADTEITVSDTLPTNTTYISGVSDTAGHTWTCPAGPISGSPGPVTISCTRTVSGLGADTLRGSGSTTVRSSDIRFTLRADSGAGANMTNNARVDITSGTAETNTANNTANQSTGVRGSADLSIVKTASATSILAGQDLTYTITVSNLSGVNAVATGINNVSVTDNMTTNPGATFVSASGTGWTCNNLINLVCDYNASLLPGESKSFTVTVKPTTVGLARSNTATAVLRLSGTTNPVDPDASNNASTVLVDVLTAVDLFVTKTDAPDPVRAGTNLTYVVTVGNSGPGNATTVTMTDTLPAELTLSSITPSGTGTCTTSPASTSYTSAATTVNPKSAFTSLTCTWPTLASASQQTVTIIGKPTNAAYPTGLSNSVSVTHGNIATVPESNSANNTATQLTTVLQPQVDLLVNKIDTPDPVARFTNTIYTVTVQNQGPSVATNVVVTETLPHTHLSYISATPSQGTCGAPVANVMTCNLGNIDVGSNVTIAIEMSADSLGTDTNSVSVTSSESDTNLANNSVSENTTVQLGADLIFTKLATPDPVIAGNAVFYFLKVKNTGPANANVTITDTLPAGIAYQSAVTSQGSCSHVAGVVTCNLGLVPYTATAQVTLTAIAMVGGLQTNTATAGSTTPDPNPVDNTDTADVTVIDGIVRGRVFADNGLGGGTANNGLQNGGELGISNVIVKLTDCGTTDYVFAQTDGLGDYQLIVPALLATGAVLCVVETNLSGYRNTGGSAGTTAGTYNITTDKTQFTYTDGVTYTGVNFADVAQSQLFTDGIQQSEPNTSVVYAHRFIAGSDGQVSFSTTSIATPNSLFWTNVLYNDLDCDGVLDAGEPVISGLYTVQAGDNICLLNKQFVPSNATQGALNVVTLSSSFVYDTLAPTVTEVLTRTDTTTVGLTSTLTLHKSVDKATAAPGETITYTITYSNNGTQPIGNIVVHDSVPAFTHSPVATCVMPLPANITVCTPAITTPSIQWNMTGTLAPSQQGQVRFSTTLDN
ncbi:MAG: DUF11 domain-containing protein [Moraxellaceae bacterium]|nr:DUF11 domain-containing protein [Moraxellaceae bacterium]